MRKPRLRRMRSSGAEGNPASMSRLLRKCGQQMQRPALCKAELQAAAEAELAETELERTPERRPTERDPDRSRTSGAGGTEL